MKAFHLFLCMSLVIAIFFAGCSDYNKKAIYHKDQQLKLGTLAIDFQEDPKLTDKMPVLTKASGDIKADGLVSDLYRLDVKNPIHVAAIAKFDVDILTLPESTNNECFTIGIGIEIEQAKETTVLFRHLDVTIDDQNIFVQFVPSDYQESIVLGISSDIDNSIPTVFTSLYIGLFQSIVQDSPDTSCRVFFPTSQNNEPDDIVAMEERKAFVHTVESILQGYINKGYRFTQEPLHPFHIYFQNIGSNGYYVEGKISSSSSASVFHSVHQGCIYLNSSFLQNGSVSNDVQPTLAHEMFHLVQSSYAPISQRSRWLDEATASYYEWSVDRKIPTSTTEQWIHLLDGVIPSKNDSMNGYARMPLIEYCVNQQTEQCIIDAYEKGSRYGDWESAIYSLLPNSPQNWVTDFYTQYFLGRIASSYSPMHLYNEIINKNKKFSQVGKLLHLPVLVQGRAKEQMKNPKQITSSTSLSIPPWGVRCLAITIDDKEVNQQKAEWDLQINIEANVSVSIIAMQENKFTMHQGEQTLIIKNVKKLFEEETRFLVVIVGLQDTLQEDCVCTATLIPHH